jgi:RimJ/RimL family protein N-acetyltransferase
VVKPDVNMAEDLYTGTLVRLKVLNPATASEAIARWELDSEYHRLDDSDPAFPPSAKRVREKAETAEPPGDSFTFAIHTLADDRLIGIIGVEVTRWVNGDAYAGIGIGERDVWGKGNGTDAMRVMLRYTFRELNLHRVSLTVFEYNPRAIRSYEKAGFVVEGRLRGWLNREGRRWDMIHMGILREEWERLETGD